MRAGIWHLNLALLTLLAIVLWSAEASAVSMYVDKDGRGGSCSDSRDRTAAQNPATPVCTIERGLALAQAGDVVLVRGATFMRTSTLTLNKGNVTLKAYPGENVVLDFANAGPRNGVNFAADGVVLEGFEIRNAQAEGVSGWFTKNIVIRRNHIHHCGLTLVGGKYQNALAAYGTNVLIEQNHIHDTGSHNIYVYGSGITIRNNLIYKTIAPGGRGSYGIQVGTVNQAVGSVTIAHNVIAESVNRSAIVLYAPGASINDVTIVNNVLITNAGNPVYVYNDAGVASSFQAIQIRNNIFADNAGGDCVFFTATNSCSGAPAAFTVSGNLQASTAGSIGFRNLGGRDYYPAPGSMMLDRGLPGFAVTDYVGASRPRGTGPDIGAFEFAGGPDVIPPAPVRDLTH